MRIRPRAPLALGLILVACHGCGSGEGPLPDLVPIKGKVTYKGQPITKGIIRFEPDGYGRMATGKIEPDGSFVLSTQKDGDGVVAGAHKVFITDVDKTLAKDRSFKKYMTASEKGLVTEVTPEKTELAFDLK